MNCPICNVALQMPERQGIEIDYCPQCRGVWLDRGELDKIIERAVPSMQPEVRREQPQYESKDSHHEDKHGQFGYGKNRKKSFFEEASMKSLAMILVLIAASYSYSVADDHKEKKHKNIAPVTNELYKASCGGCHFAYQPGLMPKRSWINMLDGKGTHPGGDLTLSKATKDKIKDYLVQGSADSSPSERSRKILASLSSSDTPMRITDIPYIQKKHRKINKDIFKRPSIGSAGNCKACHKNAEQGIYEDDDVVIPVK